MIVAGLYHLVGSYSNVEPFFATLGFIGTLSGIALIAWDSKNGGNLKSAEFNAAEKSSESDSLLLGQEGLFASSNKNASMAGDSGV